MSGTHFRTCHLCETMCGISVIGDPYTHIMVYKGQEQIEGDRVVCKVPLFEAGKSATEKSLVAYGNAMVVQNDYGHVFEGNALETSPGIMRVDVREDRSGCDVIWYLTAVDWENGKELWHRLISPGTGTLIDTLSSVTAPVVLGQNGGAYVGIRTGVVMAKDAD